ELQTAYVLENLKETFEAAGSSLDHVAKAQVFLTDLKDFHGFDSVWKRYFKVPPPRTTIGCTGLLVKDTLVEIDLVGYRSGLKHDVVKSAAPRPLAHYSEGFTLGSHVFAAGQGSAPVIQRTTRTMFLGATRQSSGRQRLGWIRADPDLATPRRAGFPVALFRTPEASRRLHRRRRAWESDRAAPSGAARCRPAARGKRRRASPHCRRHRALHGPSFRLQRIPREPSDDTRHRFSLGPARARS